MEGDSASLSDELSIQRVRVTPDPIESYGNRPYPCRILKNS